jgi:hypothetical protein
MKRCNVCGELKPLEDFYPARGMRDGRRNDCKPCNLAAKKRRYEADPATEIARVKKWQQENAERLNAYRRAHNATPERKRALRSGYYRRTYGLTADEVDDMLAAQGGVCAICKERPEVEARMHVDHEHCTGTIRGVLCSRCNHAIGLLREDPVLFARAADYLSGR